MIKVRVFATELLAAVYVAAKTEGLIMAREGPVLGLATGATPVNLYRQLVNLHRQGLSFARTTTVNLDEYVGLSTDHVQSYHRFMREHLFDHIDIPPEQTFIPDGMADDLASECSRYDDIITTHPVDLQILGIGRNGHIGFNEPDTSMKALTHVQTLTPETVATNARFFANAAQMPQHAITMGLQSILRAKAIILMAFGEDKAWSVQRAMSGEISPSLPASFLQMHADVTFVLDIAAARRLVRNSSGTPDWDVALLEERAL